MQQIINFIIRNKNFLLFLLLFGIGLIFTIQSHSYHKSRFVNSANFLSGGVYNSVNNISSYFDLRAQNQLLAEENKRLNELLFNSKTDNDSTTEHIPNTLNYAYTAANVIRNNYSLTNNFLLVNRGKNDSINEDFGVISTLGIVGIIDGVSNNYARVISILNSKSSISVTLKKSGHIGSLTWNGNSPNIIQLIDVEKIAPVSVGDTIVTSGQSLIFPKNIPVGTVLNSKLDATENFYEIDVKLFNDMTSIEHVYIIKNTNKKEIETLLENTNE
ncbi:rod shape-determining protein MreC [Hyunsoonleella pacifica]|uniref:Cell shape-determining protein MreC n=1 Tax=Hyunsoonleella pacifica TaxID=1080224 RepID=A0A4Q9FM69_9FLAO|nr:rod shape-determining protein MreC [Hyunsoonleella pacifica]TBN14467.1 rod shape-determining protein MreC [Hyunsoonleella pacifica]